MVHHQRVRFHELLAALFSVQVQGEGAGHQIQEGVPVQQAHGLTIVHNGQSGQGRIGGEPFRHMTHGCEGADRHHRAHEASGSDPALVAKAAP